MKFIVWNLYKFHPTKIVFELFSFCEHIGLIEWATLELFVERPICRHTDWNLNSLNFRLQKSENFLKVPCEEASIERQFVAKLIRAKSISLSDSKSHFIEHTQVFVVKVVTLNCYARSYSPNFYSLSCYSSSYYSPCHSLCPSMLSAQVDSGDELKITLPRAALFEAFESKNNMGANNVRIWPALCTKSAYSTIKSSDIEDSIHCHTESVLQSLYYGLGHASLRFERVVLLNGCTRTVEISTRDRPCKSQQAHPPVSASLY